MPMVDVPIPNTAIEKMCEAAGGQSELARMFADETGQTFYQSYIYRYAYLRGQIPERHIEAALVICKELGLSKIKAHDLRPSMPRVA